MSVAIPIKREITPELSKAVEEALVQGDLSKLTVEERIAYYLKTCESLGLNPYTKPFEYITLNGKLTLYARKDCTDQLRNVHQISCEIKAREKIGDLFVVTARAIKKDGRVDESTGFVNVASLRGDALANACMKAETKSKRRVTLSICGLGFIDESEIESIPGAIKVSQDYTPPKAKTDEEPKASAVRITPTYDSENQAQKDALFKILDSKHVAQAFHPELSDAMKGRPFKLSEVEAVLKENDL